MKRTTSLTNISVAYKPELKRSRSLPDVVERHPSLQNPRGESVSGRDADGEPQDLELDTNLTNDASIQSPIHQPTGALADQSALNPVNTTPEHQGSGDPDADLERRFLALSTPAHRPPQPASQNLEAPPTDLAPNDENLLLPDVPVYRSGDKNVDPGERHGRTDEDLDRRFAALRGDAVPGHASPYQTTAQRGQSKNVTPTDSPPTSDRQLNNHDASGNIPEPNLPGQPPHGPSHTPNPTPPDTPRIPATHTPQPLDARNVDALKQEADLARQHLELFEEMLSLLEKAKNERAAAGHPVPPNLFSYVENLFADAIDVCNEHANTATAKWKEAMKAAPPLQHDVETVERLASLASGKQGPITSTQQPRARPKPRLQSASANLSKELDLIPDAHDRKRIAQAAEHAQKVINNAPGSRDRKRTNDLNLLRLRAQEEFREAPRPDETRLAKHRRKTDDSNAYVLADIELKITDIEHRVLTASEKAELKMLSGETGLSEPKWRASKQAEVVRYYIQRDLASIKEAQSKMEAIKQRAAGQRLDTEAVTQLEELQYTIIAAEQQIASHRQMIKKIDRAFEPATGKREDLIAQSTGPNTAKIENSQSAKSTEESSTNKVDSPSEADDELSADLDGLLDDLDRAATDPSPLTNQANQFARIGGQVPQASDEDRERARKEADEIVLKLMGETPLSNQLIQPAPAKEESAARALTNESQKKQYLDDYRRECQYEMARYQANALSKLNEAIAQAENRQLTNVEEQRLNRQSGQKNRNRHHKELTRPDVIRAIKELQLQEMKKAQLANGELVQLRGNMLMTEVPGLEREKEMIRQEEQRKASWSLVDTMNLMIKENES
ncbi:hypothetical protein [uncultured Hydrogenophaga sp.]|uniref:hypothetical protein n=1 Tax=uncultured Hydrogenophaga sp. TaxID=199683 RepID=UPI00258CE33E|nr:hypothetical protein [uncultured Hydrogenophaga sp.]